MTVVDGDGAPSEVLQLLRTLGLEDRFGAVLAGQGFVTAEHLRTRRAELGPLMPLGPRARLLRAAEAAADVGADPLEARGPVPKHTPQQQPQAAEAAPVIGPAALRAFASALAPFLTACTALTARLLSVAAAGRAGAIAHPLGAASRAKHLVVLCRRAQKAIARGAEGEAQVAAVAAELRLLREKGIFLSLERSDPLKQPLPPLPQLAPPPASPAQALPPAWIQVLEAARHGHWAVPADGSLFTQQEATVLRALRRPYEPLRRAITCAALLTQHIAGGEEDLPSTRWDHPSAFSPRHRPQTAPGQRERWRGCRGSSGGRWQAMSAEIRELPRRVAGLVEEDVMRHAVETAPQHALRRLYDFAADPLCSVAELQSACNAAGGLALWLHAAAAFANALAGEREAAERDAQPAATTTVERDQEPRSAGPTATPEPVPPPPAPPPSTAAACRLLQTLRAARGAVSQLCEAAGVSNAPTLKFPVGCEVRCVRKMRGKVCGHSRGRIGVRLRDGRLGGFIPEQLRFVAPPTHPRGGEDDDSDDDGGGQLEVGSLALWHGERVTVCGHSRGRVGITLADGSRRGVLPSELKPLSAQEAVRRSFPCGLRVEVTAAGVVTGGARGRVGVTLRDGRRLGLPPESVSLRSPAPLLEGGGVVLACGARGCVSRLTDSTVVVDVRHPSAETAAGEVTVAAGGVRRCREMQLTAGPGRTLRAALKEAEVGLFSSDGIDDPAADVLLSGPPIGFGWGLLSAAGKPAETPEDAEAAFAACGSTCELVLVSGAGTMPEGAEVRCVTAVGRVSGHTADGLAVVADGEGRKVRAGIDQLRQARTDSEEDPAEGGGFTVGKRCRLIQTGAVCKVTGVCRGRVGVELPDGSVLGVLPHMLTEHRDADTTAERFPHGCAVEVKEDFRGTVVGHSRGRVGVELLSGVRVGCLPANLSRAKHGEERRYARVRVDEGAAGIGEADAIQMALAEAEALLAGANSALTDDEM